MPKAWTYEKEGGETFPVKPRDIWKCGPHIICCGDLQENQLLHYLDKMNVVNPSITYVDPPWNSGNARHFRTKAGLETQAPVDFAQFLRDLLGPLRELTGDEGDVFIEGGVKQTPMLHEIAVEMGFQVVQWWTITYYRTKPCTLTHLTKGQPVVLPDPEKLEGMDDDFTPGYILGNANPRPKIVLDPCTGRGLTAVTAHKLGMEFVGFELNPYRISVTLTKLQKLGAGTPEKVDEV